jgi:hypothetical protein
MKSSIFGAFGVLLISGRKLILVSTYGAACIGRRKICNSAGRRGWSGMDFDLFRGSRKKEVY